MNNLPFFLTLIKKNILIWTIVSTGAFSKADFKHIKHDFVNKHWLELNNYSLDLGDRFTCIYVITDPFYKKVVLFTSESKYLQNTKYYFGTDVFQNLSASDRRQALRTYSIFTNIQPIQMGKDTFVKADVGYYQENTYRIVLYFYPKKRSISK